MAVSAQRLREVADVLLAHDTEFRTAVHRRFYLDFPEALSVFPRSLEHSHLELTAACAWVLRHAGDGGTLPKEVLARLEQLGRDHRRHGFPSPVYQAFGRCLRAGLAEVLSATLTDAHLTPLLATAGDVLDSACAAMAAASLAAAQAGEPAAYSGEVIDVRRATRRVSLVTVDCGLPVPFTAGQHLLASSPYLPGRWLPLTPTMPPTDFGQLEFYVQAGTGSDYQGFAHARPGDRWTFGQPTGGGLTLDGPQERIVMVAHGPGIAALRALLFERLTRPNPPRIELYLGAEYPGELVEYPRLRGLAAAVDFLDLIPFSAHARDAWWVGGTDPLPEPPADLLVTDNIAAVILARGNRTGDTVLVAGPAAAAAQSVATFTAAGLADVRAESWAAGESGWVGVD